MPTIVGTSGNDDLQGTSGDDLIQGLEGNDTLVGNGGNDTMVGGAGDDTYYVDVATDTIVEAADGGTDSINLRGLTSLYFMPANVERIGSSWNMNQAGLNVIGNASDNLFTGGDGANYFEGGAGADTANGSFGADRFYGGAGSDTLNGGDGDDRLYGDADRDFLYGGNGADILNGGDGDDSLYGESGDDIILGGAGVDFMAGGAGIDQLIGGAGNDVYVAVDRDDSFVEYAGEGTSDTVETAMSVYALEWSGFELEDLRASDNAAHTFVGNALNNGLYGGLSADSLFGRAGNDSLYGGTGAANTLVGGTGNDTYYVNAVGDSIFENAGEGTDTVVTTMLSHVLRDNVENLTFQSAMGSTGIGNALANVLTGNSGADFLSGQDGDDILIGNGGSDTLFGGAGADQFRYFNLVSAGGLGLDRIFDFVSGQDRVMVDLATFTRTGTAVLVQGGAPVATTAAATFLYDVNTGIVSYDPDGTGSAAAVQLAQLNAGLTLTINDFGFF